MVGPLVEDLSALLLHLVGNGVLADDGTLTLKQQLVDAMVDLTVEVVGPAGEYNDGPLFFSCILYDYIPLGTDGPEICFVSLIAFFASLSDFLFGNIIALSDDFIKPFWKEGSVG